MMKQLATGMALGMLCLPAMAESEIGFYSGLGVGHVTLKDNISGFSIEETGTAYSIFGGYRFNEYGSLELAYVTGTGDDRISGVTVETDASGLQASALLQIPISARFEGFLRAGFLMWDAEHSVAGVEVLETDGTDWIVGIGAAWHVTPRFGLRAEYGAAELDGTDVRSALLGGLFRF